MKSGPCKDCPDRHTACWSECEKYIRYRNQVDGEKAYMRNLKDRQKKIFRAKK